MVKPFRTTFAAGTIALLAGASVWAGDAPLLGGYGGLTRKVEAGPHLSVVAATHFGGAGYEEFVGCGELADGTIVAMGNAWGPEFPKRVPAKTLGSGRHTGAPATVTDAKTGKVTPNHHSVDLGGMVVLYGPDLKAKSMIRFDWGVASITAGRVAGDGVGIIIAGRCLPAFSSLGVTAKHIPWAPPAATGKGKPAQPGDDVYVARLTADAKVEWVVVLDKNGDTPEALFSDKIGNVYFDARGLQKVSANGSEVKLLVEKSGTGTSRWLGVDPKDGSSFFGGDRNTNTGREPYRQPYCYKFDPAGQKVATLWEPDPKSVSSAPGSGHLESDSSIRTMAVDQAGDLLFTGWSDGGNSVLPRQPLGWQKGGMAGKGMGMSTAGMNAGSVTHLMRIDAATFEGKQHSIWMGVVPMFFGEPGTKQRGKPNGTSVSHITVLAHGEVAITGTAATGLIQTPNAFWKDPMLPDKHSGATVTVFRPDLSNLMFSSYLPGVDDLNLAATKAGVVVVGRSNGDDHWVKPTKAPSVHADQEFAGGSDAFILLLKLP